MSFGKFFVKQLTTISFTELKALMNGFETSHMYEVKQSSKSSTDLLDGMTIELRLVHLNSPICVKHDYLQEADVVTFSSFLPQGLSFGCFQEQEAMCGFLIAEYQEWNNSVSVREFQIGKAYRGKGIGQMLLDALEKACVERNIRCIVCETQVVNYPALQFYKKHGFTLDGIDLSFYSNDDYSKQNIAVFMKKKFQIG